MGESIGNSSLYVKEIVTKKMLAVGSVFVGGHELHLLRLVLHFR
jgi:hypothetical protein